VGNVVTVAPAVEPVTVAEVMRHCRIDSLTSDEQTDVETMIQAARERVEEVLWRALITQTRKQTLDEWPAGDQIDLDYPPLQSVTSITYVDTGGTEQTLSTDAYDVTTTDLYGRITLAHGYTWPTARDDADTIQITYVAGYGDAASDVPAMIRLAIKQIVADWWEHREPTLVGTISSQIPNMVLKALGPFRAYECV